MANKEKRWNTHSGYTRLLGSLTRCNLCHTVLQVLVPGIVLGLFVALFIAARRALNTEDERPSVRPLSIVIKDRYL